MSDKGQESNHFWPKPKRR